MNGLGGGIDMNRADKAKLKEKDTCRQKRRYKMEFRLLLIPVGKYSLHFTHLTRRCSGLESSLAPRTVFGFRAITSLLMHYICFI